MKNKKHNFPTEPSVFAPTDLPETAEEMVNKYGTYEIQSTAETENQYPAGLTHRMGKRAGWPPAFSGEAFKNRMFFR